MKGEGLQGRTGPVLTLAPKDCGLHPGETNSLSSSPAQGAPEAPSTCSQGTQTPCASKAFHDLHPSPQVPNTAWFSFLSMHKESRPYDQVPTPGHLAGGCPRPLLGAQML